MSQTKTSDWTCPRTSSVWHYWMAIDQVDREPTEFRFTHELVTTIANTRFVCSFLCLFSMPISHFVAHDTVYFDHILMQISYTGISVQRILWFQRIQIEEGFWLTRISASMLDQKSSSQTRWRGQCAFSFPQRSLCH